MLIEIRFLAINQRVKGKAFLLNRHESKGLTNYIKLVLKLNYLVIWYSKQASECCQLKARDMII